MVPQALKSTDAHSPPQREIPGPTPGDDRSQAWNSSQGRTGGAEKVVPFFKGWGSKRICYPLDSQLRFNARIDSITHQRKKHLIYKERKAKALAEECDLGGTARCSEDLPNG